MSLPAVSTPSSAASSMSPNMASHSPGLKSTYSRPESGGQFAENEKERINRKKTTLGDLYESNHGLKRRFTPAEISDFYSYKKTVRDLKYDNNGSSHSEHHSDDEDNSAFARSRLGDLPSPSLKSSLSPSMRSSELPFYPNFSQSLSVSKSNHHFTSPTTHLNSSSAATAKHSSLSSVSSIPANQLRAHVNRADADEITDLEELEQFAKTFKQRRIKLGMLQTFNVALF